MVRDVQINRCYTSCHPGADTNQIDDVIPQLLKRFPSACAVVAHVGAINDLKFEQSIKLKISHLIDRILQSNSQCIIPHHLPNPPTFGKVKFSRLRQLHIWLKGYCNIAGIPYADNFTAFLNRPDFFKQDRLHLNRAGSLFLSQNINLTLQSCKALSAQAPPRA